MYDVFCRLDFGQAFANHMDTLIGVALPTLEVDSQRSCAGVVLVRSGGVVFVRLQEIGCVAGRLRAARDAERFGWPACDCSTFAITGLDILL